MGKPIRCAIDRVDTVLVHSSSTHSSCLTALENGDPQLTVVLSVKASKRLRKQLKRYERNAARSKG